MSLIDMASDTDINRETRANVQSFSRTTGDIDNIYKLLMTHKPLFAAWTGFGGALFNATLPFRDREIAVLRVLCNARDDYDWTHHVGICQDHKTLTETEVQAIAGLVPHTDAKLSDHDRLLLQAVDELMTEYRIRRGTLAILKKTYSGEQLIELTQLAAFYIGIAFTNNTAELPLEPQFPSLKTW
jgi:4-carboxymuconolactone decarboxylase